MRKPQKILTGALWALTVLAMMSVIGAGLWKRQRDTETAGFEINAQPASGIIRTAVLATVPSFSLLDQDNKPLTHDTLHGHPYIADFIFTRCAGPCPIMTSKMAALTKSIPDPRVRFLSVTVDPEYDKPNILKQYARDRGADDSRWLFATGDKDAVFALARGMLIAALPAQGDQPIIHSEKFILVDSAGQIRAYYNSKDGDAMVHLIADAQELAAQSPATSKPANPAP